MVAPGFVPVYRDLVVGEIVLTGDEMWFREEWTSEHSLSGYRVDANDRVRRPELHPLYRDLAPDEILQREDERFRPSTNAWEDFPSYVIGDRHRVLSAAGWRVRRRVLPFQALTACARCNCRSRIEGTGYCWWCSC